MIAFKTPMVNILQVKGRIIGSSKDLDVGHVMYTTDGQKVTTTFLSEINFPASVCKHVPLFIGTGLRRDYF